MRFTFASLLSGPFRNGGFCAALVAAILFPANSARAAFHLWNIAEIYSDSSGSLQFIEFNTVFGSQQFVSLQPVQVQNVAATLMNSLNLPHDLPGDSANHSFLIGTAGIQAAGAPAPDFIMPNNFLFTAGGTINFFGANSGPYSAMPTDGLFSLIWGGGTAVNSPRNFAGQTGVISVPEPAVCAVIAAGAIACVVFRRRGCS